MQIWLITALCKNRPDCSRSFCGVHGGIRTLDPRIHTATVFTAADYACSGIKAFAVWTVSSSTGNKKLFPAMSPVQSLHLPCQVTLWQGLARDWHGTEARAFPEFERIHQVVSRSWRPISVSGILCSILLSYVDTRLFPSCSFSFWQGFLFRRFVIVFKT